MAARFLIKDRENKPYALVEILPDGAQFHPVVAAAKSWSKWMADEYAGKKISKEELTVTLDNSMSLETTVSDSVVEELKNRSLTKPSKEIEKKDASAELLPVISLMDIQLSEFPVEAWKNAVQYKAVAFIADQNKSSFTYEVKRTRSVWDASLAVPGTERRGGFRCPVGTRYGGQITDRFGRNCGWGVARRLANEISDLGERLENVGDRRRERRVTRRNERMARRLAGGGAIERGARAVGDALDLTGMGGRQGGQRNRTGQVDTVKPGRLERAAGRIADVVDPDKPTRNRRAPARNPRPAAPQRNPRRRPNLRDSEERRMEREIDNPGAPRTGDAPVAPANRPRPAAPRRPANPRPARPRNVPVDNTSGVPVPAGAPSARESLDTYKTRKYNEHQAEVRRIRDGGGNAGFLRRSEWERFHGPAVEQAWRDRNPDAGNAPARPRPNGGRGRRTGAAAQNGRRPANRRPRPNDQPDAVQPAAPRPRRPAARQFTPSEEAGLREELNQLREDRDQNVPGANRDARIAQLERILGEQAAPAPAPARPPRAPRAPRNAGTGSRVRKAPNIRVKQNDNKIGDIANGVPDIRHIPKGNKNINVQADADLHLANGGDIRDVPDDFLFNAMKANSGQGKRFTKSTLGGGINGSADLFTDTATGKKFFVKFSGDHRGRTGKLMFGKNEDLNEIVGNNVAARLGFPVGEFRFAGPPFNGQPPAKARPIMFEHVGNYVASPIKPRGRNDVPNVVKDKVRATFLDYLIMNTDRHNENYFLVTQNGKKHLVPIDNGLGFRGRQGYFQSGDYANESGFRTWLADGQGGNRNPMRAELRNDQRSEVIREIGLAQDALRAAQRERDIADFGRDAVEARRDPSGLSVSPGHNDHVDGLAARQEYLLNLTPEQIYNLITAR
jgi:hypothetical protein